MLDENMTMEVDGNMTLENTSRDALLETLVEALLVNKGKNGSRNSNGTGNSVNWDTIYKVSQLAIYPLLGAMFYILIQMSSFDRRLAIIETNQTRPDISIAQKLSVIEDRQNTVMRELTDTKSKISEVILALTAHDVKVHKASAK